ncbi:helix-turn-helix domain-containing protein [Fodinicola feengrottensis]|uniref:Helix-turn-helix domain-containing protein n=1 Tax=Fodinicola feengrottensis TaxID=435914 RepID=A0ABN2ILR2_9ACTN|nr:helix-turn-helix domain-containing protein [Fodinicola feengrottensis]
MKTEVKREMAPPAPRFYTVAEVARMLSISTRMLYTAINNAEFPAVRIRGRFVIPARAINEMVAAAIQAHGLVDASDWVAQDGAA